MDSVEVPVWVWGLVAIEVLGVGAAMMAWDYWFCDPALHEKRDEGESESVG